MREFTIEKLSSGLDCKIAGDGQTKISGVKYNASEISGGDLFVCVKGLSFDGHDFASLAVQNGAAGLLVNRLLNLDIPQIVVEDTRYAMGKICSNFYKDPSSRLKMIGVTGTNGKTTVTFMLRSIFEAAGLKFGVMGTLGSFIGSELIDEGRTTPESADSIKFLDMMAAKGAGGCVMELSSHAIHQKRYSGIKFDTLIFTNISRDHLDYHKDMESYIAAKAAIFNDTEAHKDGITVVFNGDDPEAVRVTGRSAARRVSYGMETRNDIFAEIRESDIGGSKISVTNKLSGRGSGPRRVSLNLAGLHNVYNSLAGIAAAYTLGIPADSIVRGLETLKSVPGRIERIDGGDFTVLVDYAHTPDGLKNILEAIKPESKGRIITVFGCGGDRDKLKRPLMGRVVSDLSEIAIVTSDNPRSEDPASIIEQVVENMDKTRCEIEADRKKAIRRALSIAEKGDIVLIAGKGHETYQEINGKLYDFDDRRVVREILESK